LAGRSSIKHVRIPSRNGDYTSASRAYWLVNYVLDRSFKS
jgi:hypothetical protein